MGVKRLLLGVTLVVALGIGLYALANVVFAEGPYQSEVAAAENECDIDIDPDSADPDLLKPTPALTEGQGWKWWPVVFRTDDGDRMVVWSLRQRGGPRVGYPEVQCPKQLGEWSRRG